MPDEAGEESGPARQPPPEGVVDRELDDPGGALGAQVEERPIDRGRRDARSSHDLAPVEVGALMRADASAAVPPVAGHRDVDGARAATVEVPQSGGGAVGGDRALASGEDGGQDLGLPGDRRAADADDTPVDLRPPPGGNATANGGRAEAEGLELGGGGQAVLPGREAGDGTLRSDGREIL